MTKICKKNEKNFLKPKLKIQIKNQVNFNNSKST